MEQEPKKEDVESRIGKLLEKLESLGYLYASLDESMQESWYYTEMEGKTGLDREEAARSLEEFITTLEAQKKE